MKTKRSFALGYGSAAVFLALTAVWLIVKGTGSTAEPNNSYGFAVLAAFGAVVFGFIAWGERGYAKRDHPYTHSANTGELEFAQTEDDLPQSGDVIQTILPGGCRLDTEAEAEEVVVEDKSAEKPEEPPFRFDENVRITF